MNAPAELPRISDAAIEMIIGFEVSNRRTYEREAARPTWPGGYSGVTIGIGYDVGQTTRDLLEADWDALLPPAWITRLAACCGITGTAAAPLIGDLRDISVPYDAAIAVYRHRSIPQTTAQVIHALPQAATLPPDCLGALVSLAYNRGPNFHAADDRHREMRAIAAALADGHPDQVPQRIRDMKRLWVENPEDPVELWRPLHGLAGLLPRRDTEADFFAEGLAAHAASEPAPSPASAAAAIPVHAVGDIERAGSG